MVHPKMGAIFAIGLGESTAAIRNNLDFLHELPNLKLALFLVGGKVKGAQNLQQGSLSGP